MYIVVFKFNSLICKICLIFHIIICVQFKILCFFFRQIFKIKSVQVGWAWSTPQPRANGKLIPVDIF